MESQLRFGDLGIVVRGKNNNGFFDNSHFQYYNNNGGLSIWCGEKTKNKKKEMKVEVNLKKKMKLLKGLSTNLSMYSEMGICGESVDGGGNMLSHLSRVLLDQLQQVKAEKKEIKRNKKEEKKKLKALRMKSNKSDSDSSSSSSESSDDECEKVVNMKHLRSSALAQLTNVNVVKETTLSVSSYHPTASKCEETDKVSRQRSSTATEASVDELQQFQADTSISSSSLLSVREHEKVEERDEDRHSPMCDTQECCTSKKSRAQSSACENNGSLIETFGERIDVCMGGKCKKFGAAELLEELQKKIGMEGVVVGCKCMGKCKNAPNVRVLNKRSMNSAEGMGTSISAPSNPLYLGVGLDDIDIIVSNFLGEGRTKNIGSMAAA